MLKSLLRAPLLNVLLVRALRAYLALALKTTRWKIQVDPQALPHLTGRSGSGVIVAFWHETLAITPVLRWWADRRNPAQRVHVMISRNRDGRIIADIVRPWRVLTIAGSSSRPGKNKGGISALRQSLSALKNGDVITITPDGPKGPRHVVQPGTLMLAEHTAAPIVPVGADCSCFRLKSWDRMMLPLPFGRGVIVCGAPIAAIPAEDTAQRAQMLAAAINAAVTQAGEQCQTRRPAVWRLWSLLGRLAAPGLAFLVRRRARRGKEVQGRTLERLGFASLARPAGKVIWIHAASVGETMSILPVVEDILARGAPTPTVLFTTATLTAAEIVASARSRLGDGLIHQFLPFDVTRWSRRFLDHWRPDCAVLVESELWPGLISECRARHIRLALVNARMSASSWKQWRKAPAISARLFSAFDWIAARSAEDAARLRALGADHVEQAGDLKQAAPALPADSALLSALHQRLAGRTIWLAAATHAGEEEIVADAARILHTDCPQLLTVIVPRHPGRGAEIASLLGNAPRRALGQFPLGSDPIWVCDTLGELGLFYRLAPICFLGNSLPGNGKRGGHNPYEPARLSCVIATGPLTDNFNDAFAALSNTITRVENAHELSSFVRARLLDDQARTRQIADGAMQIATTKADIAHYFATRIASMLSA